jgi:uncharacterized membrane protein
MTEWLAVARAVHVLAIVHWIGGLLFVTFVVLPGLLKVEASRRAALFEQLEGRFALQARVSTLLAGASGLYLLHGLTLWPALLDPRFWWLGAMIVLWLVFIVMLFVAEPLFLHAWFEKRAKRDPDGTFRIALWSHRVLSLATIITVLGAVAGVHGLSF